MSQSPSAMAATIRSQAYLVSWESSPYRIGSPESSSGSYGAVSTAWCEPRNAHDRGQVNALAAGRHRHNAYRLANQVVPAVLVEVVEHPGRGFGGVARADIVTTNWSVGVDRGLPVRGPYIVASIHDDELVEPADHLADVAERLLP